MPNYCCYYFEMIWLLLRLLFMSAAFPISMDFDTLSDTGSKTQCEAGAIIEFVYELSVS
ncbi:uncharacterized protein DS421_13g416750 [Arachis hypogaea]|nr:uncharacterized protein DS421_13g416750 [Arachis hypogaea]